MAGNSTQPGRFDVVSVADESRFVGLDVDSSGPFVVFPLGYKLAESYRERLSDARLLIRTIVKVQNEGLGATAIRAGHDVSMDKSVPVESYGMLIESFVSKRRLLTEVEPKYGLTTNGPVSWSRTIARGNPAMTRSGHPIYLDLVRRGVENQLESLIAQLHRFALKVSFEKIGWIYGIPNSPVTSDLVPHEYHLQLVMAQLHKTFRDEDVLLLRSIYRVLEGEVENASHSTSVFGTTRFDLAWEYMVDRAFSSPNYEKSKFFPRGKYKLKLEKRSAVQAPLMIDSIMEVDGDFYVLDAKYYRYGVTREPKHLPGSSDIGKQVVYGEYAKKYVRDVLGFADARVFNAFLIPTDDANVDMQYAGFASGDWNAGEQSHERVSVVLVNSNFLLHSYTVRDPSLGVRLATEIRKSMLV